jgi:hypothetical protein
MTTAARPQWIARMYPGKVGRDHLGLGSVSSDQILPSLSPGINVLTIHPRYFSFYVFLLDEFWQRDFPRNAESFSAFYRPRECIFSIGAHLCDRPEHDRVATIVGAQKTSGQAAQQLLTYDPNFNYIKSDLGGYGLYYRSVMAELEVIYPGGPKPLPYPLDVPSEPGKQLAAAFRQAIQHTKYYQDYFNDSERAVPIEVLREYIRAACLCQIQRTDVPDRPLLLDMFLHSGEDRAATARRDTLRMCLDIAAQTKGSSIDQDQFRQLLYFRSSSNNAMYAPAEAVAATYRRWRLYQAREYYAFALNGLWTYLCVWGIAEHGDLRPLPIEAFWHHLSVLLSFDTLADLFGVASPELGPDSSWSRLLAWLRNIVGADEQNFDARCTLTAPIHEHQLYKLIYNEAADDPRLIVPAMLVMLALIYLRFGQPACWLVPEWKIAHMGADGRLSLDGFVKTLRGRLERQALTIGDLARWLYDEYVILQHQLVATSKLPENTFRFVREGNHLRFYDLANRLEFNDSRFDALSTTVHELGLAGDLLSPEHALTPDGRKLLSNGDLR